VTSHGAGRRQLASLVALAVVSVLVVLAVRHMSIARVFAELAAARPLWIALAVICFAAILPLWALQWRLLAPSRPRAAFSAMLGVVAMTSTVLNTTPLLVGEAAGVYFLVTRAMLARAAALSVLAMDQLFVGVAKLCVLSAAAAIVDLPAWMASGASALFVVVVALMAGLVTLAWRGEALGAAAAGWLPARITHLASAVGAALAPIRSPSLAVGALALALAKKAAEALAILCIQRAFGLELTAASALVILGAVNLATLLPVVPGNVGVYEAAVVVGYSFFGVTPERALGIAVVQHACFFVALALPGYRWLGRAALARSSAAAA